MFNGNNNSSAGAKLRVLAPAAVAGLAIAAIVQWRAYASAADSLATAQRQLTRMHEDLNAIQSLRAAPKTAAMRDRTNEELLAQAEQALEIAGIDRRTWHDSIPQPPRRIATSDYRVHATQLYFEGLTLQQIAGFAIRLQSVDPTLRISSLALNNRLPNSAAFDLEVGVSYLVYAPKRNVE